mgnify:CR=1 FL=1
MCFLLNIFSNCHRNHKIPVYTKEKVYNFQSFTSFVCTFFDGQDPYQDPYPYQDPDPYQTKSKDPDPYQSHTDPQPCLNECDFD